MRNILIGLISFVFILFVASYFYLSFIQVKPEGWFVNSEEVKGSAIQHKSSIYTLNFEQQNALIELLNRGKIVRANRSQQVNPEITAILIYLFNQDSPLALTPMTNDYSLFAISDWGGERFLAAYEPKSLQLLLSSTYDH